MGTGQRIVDLLPEPEPPKEGRWIARPRKPRWTIERSRYLFLPLAALWFLHKAAEANHWRLVEMVIGIAFVGFVLACVSSILIQGAARRFAPSEGSILDREDADHYAVEITVVVSGKPIGADRGVIWFSDGVMGFSGSAMAFVLAAEDLEAEWVGRLRSKWDRSFEAPWFALKGIANRTVVEVNPLARKGGAFEDRFRDFYGAMDRPLEERMWPPLAPFVEPKPQLEAAN